MGELLEAVYQAVFHAPRSLKTKLLFAAQICLRFLAMAASLAAACLMLTAKQTAVVEGITVDSSYSYFSAFKLLVYASLIACVFSVLSLVVAFILALQLSPNSNKFFCMFLHDLILTTMLMAGCAATTAIGNVGRYGNSHAGWIASCHQYGLANFCDRVNVSVIFSYISVAFYFCLTLISACQSRQIEA